MQKTISLIIPAWNEANILPKTVKFLKELKLPFEYSELIFIAGGTDETYDICQKLKLKNFSKTLTLKQEFHDFKTGALIKGIKKAIGEVLILMDADVFIAPNLAIEVAKALRKFDAVNCDFIPMMEKGFWYNYHTLDKKLYTYNPNNLKTLMGGPTISIKKSTVDEIGVSKLFTKKTTAGVDYYIGLILSKYEKKMGFVNVTRVLMPRPNNIKDFYKDYVRWESAFFSIHHENKQIILFSFIFSFLYCLSPIILFLRVYKKIQRIKGSQFSSLKYLIVLFLVEYLINLIRIVIITKLLSRRLKFNDHFKGVDRYIKNRE